MIPLYRVSDKFIHINRPENGQQITNDDLYIDDFRSVLRFLRNFGHLITKLIFVGNNSFSSNEKLEISKSIVEYCSNSLKEINLIESESYLTNDADQTFPNVRNVALLSFSKLNISQIHRIYPNMRELSLKYDLLVLSNSSIWKQLYISFRSSSTLRALSLSRVPSFDQLEFINNNLPNLQSLAFGYDPRDFSKSGDRNVHFVNVRHFQVTVLGGVQGVTNDSFPIAFNHLETLEMSISEFANIPVKLIEQNPGLRSLTVPFAIASRIVNNVRDSEHLEELTLKWSNDVNTGDLESLLNELGQLNRLTFIVLDSPERMTNWYALQRTIQDAWRITHYQIETKKMYIAHHVTAERVIRGTR